jgi:hypothetical protein
MLVSDVCALHCGRYMSCALHRFNQQQLWWSVCTPVRWPNHVQQQHMRVQGERRERHERRRKCLMVCLVRASVVDAQHLQAKLT